MYSVEDIKNIIGSVSEEKLRDVISKGTLKLSNNQINTVSFVFWLCYMAERDLETNIKRPWEKLVVLYPADSMGLAKKILNEVVFGSKDSEINMEDELRDLPSEKSEKIRLIIKQKYNEKQKISIDNLASFGDKIKLYEGIFTENNVALILWKIKNIRDNLSHGRINELKYLDLPLSERTTREKLLIDYLEAVSKPDHSKSNLRDKINALDEKTKAILSHL